MCKGKELKIIRIKADMKALDLCKIANISQSKLSLIENGYIECTEEMYEKLIKHVSQKY